MKKKSISFLAFICIVMLTVNLCSVFSFATEPEFAEVNAGGSRAGTGMMYEVVKVRTYLYNSNSTSSGYVLNENIPVGTEVERQDYTHYAGGFFLVTYKGRTGYILASHVALSHD